VDDVVNLGLEAGIKQLYLFHHDPDHTDDQIAQMLASARQQVAQKNGTMLVEAARERSEVLLRKKT
jgi:phosphoribosyl 1,2-cyclic phosphodiesterase